MTVTPEIIWMLTLIAATLAVFILELFSVEVTAMILLATLLISGFLDVNQALSGLNNQAVVIIGALFVLSHALVKTGILEVAADYLSHRSGQRKWLGIAVFLIVAGILSGFLNNTAVVAILMPLAVGLCRHFQLSPSKVLIPLSYVSILGGMLTVIGTSTNLLVSSLAEKAGLPPLAMFEFTKMGVIFLGLGLIYVLVFAPRSLPARAEIESLTSKYEMKPYLTELKIKDTSGLVGRSCLEAGIREKYDITVLSIIRSDARLVENISREILRPDDLLIVQGLMESIVKLRNDFKLALLTDIKLSDEELAQEGQLIAEALVTQNSSLIGKTLKEIDFRRHFGAFVLAIRRHGTTLHARVGRVALEPSDTLLLIGLRQRVRGLGNGEDLIIISEPALSLRSQRFWWVPLILFPAVILAAAFQLLDILQGAVLAVIILLASRIITSREAYRAIDWSVLFLIAAFVPVGEAMTRTGTADFIASGILTTAASLPDEAKPFLALTMVYLITSVTTQMISNNAAAILATPVALTLASALSVDPRPFLIAICFAASCDFMTPVGYQTNMMVYGPGSYRFLDYTRFGAPLNIGFWLLASYLIPIFWPF